MPRSAAEALRDGIITADVVSDVICPWCYLGKRRLEAAIERSGLPVTVLWRPFQLDPTIPPGGVERDSYLSGKFKDAAKLRSVHDTLTELGRAVGIDFRFDAIRTTPNTLDAHRLIRWATTQGRQDTVVEALFRGYFIEGLDIGDPDVLETVAVRCGMEQGLVRRLLGGDADRDDVQAEIGTAVRMGVSGVPFFILAGRYAVSGAQKVDMLVAALRKAAETGLTASA